MTAWRPDCSTGLDHPVYVPEDRRTWHLKRGCAPPGAAPVELEAVIPDAEPCGNCVADRNGNLPERVHGMRIEP